ncbi:protein of unknown function [Tenacibaculum insulae]
MKYCSLHKNQLEKFQLLIILISEKRQKKYFENSRFLRIIFTNGKIPVENYCGKINNGKIRVFKA